MKVTRGVLFAAVTEQVKHGAIITRGFERPMVAHISGYRRLRQHPVVVGFGNTVFLPVFPKIMPLGDVRVPDSIHPSQYQPVPVIAAGTVFVLDQTSMMGQGQVGTQTRVLSQTPQLVNVAWAHLRAITGVLHSALMCARKTVRSCSPATPLSNSQA